MKLTLAVYSSNLDPNGTKLTLPWTGDPKSYYGCLRLTEPVEVDFPDIVIDPADALAAIAAERQAVIVESNRKLAELDKRRAKLGAV